MIALLAVFCTSETIKLEAFSGIVWKYDPDCYETQIYNYTSNQYETKIVLSWYYKGNHETTAHNWVFWIRCDQENETMTGQQKTGYFNDELEDYLYTPHEPCLFSRRHWYKNTQEWTDWICVYDNPKMLRPTAHFTVDMSPTWQLYNKPIVAVNIFLGLFTDFYNP